MKKLFLALICCLLFTGCLKKDTFEDVDIYTTNYATQYIVDYLYGEHSNIYSIYPNGVNIETYELTDKQIKDYSSMSLYVFNGTNHKETSYINPMFKYNKNLKIIDSANTMEYTTSQKELWLDPSNFLMMALNIKNGILEYTSNRYIQDEINENYNNLKIAISKIDANLKLMSESTNNKTIIVDDNSFMFLEKYGFKVISLQEDETLTEKTILDVKNMINNGTINYIYTTNSSNLNNTILDLQENTNVKILELYTISNLTDEQRKNKDDFISLLNENIELLKNELYD